MMKADSLLIILLSISLKIEYFQSISIENYDLNGAVPFTTNDYDQTALYNKQAFGLIDLLDLLKSEKQANVRNVTAGQKGLKSYVRLSNKILNYSDFVTNESNVTTIEPKLYNNDVKPNIVTLTNRKVKNLLTTKNANFLEDERIMKKINDFNNQKINFNKEINEGINAELFPDKTYSAVLERINKLYQGSIENYLATNEIKCFKCEDLKTEAECTETEDTQAKRIMNIVCCQCNKLKKGNVGNNQEEKDTDFEWFTILAIFTIIAFLIFFAFMLYYIYKCCEKSVKSQNSSEKLVSKGDANDENINDGLNNVSGNNEENISKKDNTDPIIKEQIDPIIKEQSDSKLDEKVDDLNYDLNETVKDEEKNEPNPKIANEIETKDSGSKQKITPEKNDSNTSAQKQQADVKIDLDDEMPMPKCANPSKLDTNCLIDLENTEGNSAISSATSSKCSQQSEQPNQKVIKENYFVVRDERKSSIPKQSNQGKTTYHRYCKTSVGLKPTSSR